MPHKAMIEKIRVECPTCGGTGELGGELDVAPIDCDICGGTGQTGATPGHWGLLDTDSISQLLNSIDNGK